MFKDCLKLISTQVYAKPKTKQKEIQTSERGNKRSVMTLPRAVPDLHKRFSPNTIIQQTLIYISFRAAASRLCVRNSQDILVNDPAELVRSLENAHPQCWFPGRERQEWESEQRGAEEWGSSNLLAPKKEDKGVGIRFVSSLTVLGDVCAV